MTLESLILNHETTITELYNKLSPSPELLIKKSLNELEESLKLTISTQLLSIQSNVNQVETTLNENWKKVSDWKLALGESIGKERSEEPLLNLIIEVESILSSMRSRMEERGLLIVGLQIRLIAMREILGFEWMQVELENVENGWEGLDLRLERLSKLERELMRCDNEINHRKTILNENANEIFAIRTELGIHQDSTSTPSTSTSHSTDSVNVPISDPFDEAILCHLGIGENRIKQEISPTAENISRIEAKRQWLEEEKAHRNALVQSTYDKLFPLWTMLGVSEVEMEEFCCKWMGSTSDVVNAYQTELSRMLTLKRSNLSAFILLERASITALWDTLYLSPPQRLASFAPFTINVEPTKFWNPIHAQEEEIINENVSEELLVAHERERDRLILEVEGVKPILDRLEKYFSVVEEMRELEASASDPSRLLGKATRGDPGRLLREEKARKRVVKDKPKLEAELRSIIPTWEQQNGRPFLVNGKRFLDDLNQKEEAEALEKENKRRAKQGLSLSASSTTSHHSSSSSSSSSRTVPLRPQMTGATSSAHPPIKRQMTGSSALKGLPGAKRIVPTPTGTGNNRTILGETQGKLISQNTGRNNINNNSNLVSGIKNIGTRISNGSSGMKIPAGWGGGDNAGLDPNIVENQHSIVHPVIIPQPTGGFRPRGSNMSNGSRSSVSGR